MNAQSFEYQLRNTAPPTPDPEARLRARRAALAEFERLQVHRSPPADSARSVLGKLWASLGSRELVGGFASGCVVAIGASVLFLMPPKEREAQLHIPMVGDPPRTQLEVRPKASVVADQPVGAENAGAADAPAAAEQRPDGKQPGATQQPVPAEAAVLAKNVQRVPTQPPAHALDPQSAAQPVRPSPTGSAKAQPEQEASPARATSTPPPPQRREPPQQIEQIIVPGQRIRRESFESASPVAQLDPNVAGGLAAPTTDRPVPASMPSPSQASSPGMPAPAFQSTSVSGAQRKRSNGLYASSAQILQMTPVMPVESGDKFQHFDINAVKRVLNDPVSTFSVDVDTASYSFVRRMLEENSLPPVDAVRVEEMINYFDYAWPVPTSRDVPFKPTVTVSDSPWGEGKKLVHIGIKGYELPKAQQPDVNLVLLLDVSGSMNSPDKLPLAQQSMALLLDSLKPTDTVAIVVYAGAAGEVLAPTRVAEKETILRALNSLRPGGSTAGAAGIQLAYQLAEQNFRKNGVNRILLATDGDFNVGISDQDALKGLVQREREKGVFLSVLGFGVGNYHDETAQTLAQNGNGVAAYIDTLSEARKVLVQESTASLFTIAKDVKLQVEFNPETVAEYRLVGYETRALNREDFNNDRIDAGDVGSGHTVTAIYEITPVGSEAALVDESRYAAPEKPAATPRGKPNEYGYLKIRYKLPKETRSRLLQQPILVDAGVPSALAADVDFSTAVAGFAQLLRGGQYTGSLSFKDIVQAGQDALGVDRYGYRAEFVDLVRKAQRARAVAE